MNPPPTDSGALSVLVVLPALPAAAEAVPAPWYSGLCRQMDRLFGGDLALCFLAPACAGGAESLNGLPVHRFRPGLRPLDGADSAQDLILRFGTPLGRAGAAAYWAAGARKAATLARERAFDLVHAEWPTLTGIIARAACNARRIPLISASSAEEVEGARRDPALLARLEREWGTSDLLLVHDADTLDEVRRRSGRHADRIQELLDRGEDAESARRCADHLLEAWDRAALRGPVRSRQAGTGDGAEFRNRL